jgi:Spy/CpxP family protein refolding chaperone
MARLLNLTVAQQGSMKGVADRHQVSLNAKLAAAAAARSAMRSAMLDPATSDAQLKVLQAKVAEAQLPVMLERRAMMAEFEAVLTTDQKAVMDKQRLQGGPGSGMGRGMGRGGCGSPGMGGM